MDGYAVRAVDTYGASAALPAFLTVTGEVKMGQVAGISLAVGQTALVHTGGMIPETADAVVQVEWTQAMGEIGNIPYEIEILKSVAEGQNVLQVGEDVRQGEAVLPAGHLIRPQDIGGLLALGITKIAVSRQPRVAVIATGDEVIAPSETAAPGQIRDINSYTAAAQIRQTGSIPVFQGIVPDKLDALKTAAARALAQNDMLVMSAGSSVSVRDMTVQVIDSLGRPGVLLHGVATRPGKPTIVGVIGQKMVLGLPGNPVSAMIQFDMFGVPAIWRVQGLHSPPRRGMVKARISQNIASESGREDYVPVRLEETDEGLTAVPVFGKSNLIYTLVKADGILKVPINKSGLEVGEVVEVRLF
jgi:molybdopterin molybdotransferase